MRLLLLLIALSLLLSCGSTKPDTMSSAENGKQEIMKETTKRAPAPIAASQTAMLEKYYAIADVNSEVQDWVGNIRDQFEIGLTGGLETLGAAKSDEIRQTVAKATDEKSMINSYKTHFSKNYSAVNLGAVMAWLESPLGSKIDSMEKVLNTSEGEQAMAEYAGTLQANPPSSERMALVQEFMTSTDMVEHAVNVFSEMMLGSIKSLNPALPEADRMDNEQLSLVKGNLEAKFGAQMEQVLPIAMLFSYKDATDAELRQVIDFYNTDAGKWLTRVEVNAIGGMMSETFGNIFKGVHAVANKK